MKEQSNAQRLYNIIWADDEVHVFLNSSNAQNTLHRLGIEVIAAADTGDALIDALDKNKYLVEAVVVDANFGKVNNVGLKENQLGGLRCAMYEYRQYKGRIPFILYTQRASSVLMDTLDADEQEEFRKIFERTNRWLSKSRDWKDLAEVIKSSVDEGSNPTSIIRKAYPEVFKFTKLVDGSEELIIQGLLPDQEIKVEYSFTPLRLKWENIQGQCKRLGILPHVKGLNHMVDFLEGKEIDGYEMIQPIMPPSLVRTLDYFLNITQDGSHNDNDMKLDVVEYAAKTEDKDFYRSILYILIQLIKWFGQQLNEQDPRQRWKANYKLEGEIKCTLVPITDKDGNKHRKPCFNLKRYMLIPPRDAEGKIIRFNEGDYIGILDESQARDNTTPYTTAENEEVDKVLFPQSYAILERAAKEEKSEE